MNDFNAITTVYSYYMPEIRDIITRLTRDYPHDVFLRSITPGLDNFHNPIIDKLVQRHATDVPALGQFPARYPTSGSEEGIREFMTTLQTAGVRQIYMWKGDYEGYRDVARTRGMETVEVEFDRNPADLKPGYWFLSNPSARDGVLVPRAKIDAVLAAGHKVFYDLSYLGTTAPTVYDVAHPNVAAVAISFSKPYGLFYYRIGFLFCREAIPTLVANKWFKNVYSLLVADAVMTEIDMEDLAHQYKTSQLAIVDGINADLGLGLRPSDVFLLAHLPAAEASHMNPGQRSLIERFRRGDGYRFCLTPYFLQLEAP